jgi:DNA-binding MarR family transcriptional regulator
VIFLFSDAMSGSVCFFRRAIFRIEPCSFRPYIDNKRKNGDCQYMDDNSSERPPLPGGGNDQRLGFLIYRAGLAVSRGYERALKPLGVMPVEAGVLTALRHGGPNHVRGLARALGVGRQTIVNVTRALEERTWIGRSASEEDARLAVFTIAPAGRQKLNAIEKLASAFDAKLREVVGLEQEAGLIQQLQQIVEAQFLAHED